jgi:ligand-binding SRPBCC domain-containing protein
MIHRLYRRQKIAAEMKSVWHFFSTPSNLNALTPPDLRFRIIGKLPLEMYQGQIIEYRVQFVPRVWTKWLTEIRHVEQNHYFVDEQRIGPYQLWYHEHLFQDNNGTVTMEDRVTYSVGYGPIGDALNAIWIQGTLNRIFDYRAQKIDEIFARKTERDD